ncbi:MAG: Eco47II family restriction endonuclease [Campylobacterales bacterium]|nr:Eco47II family restriction endonuclease [Campylobacterales bacterium]
MRQYNLNFISDENLYNHVKDTVLKYRFSINLRDFNKNLIDPIKLTFDSKVYQKNLNTLIDDEIMRQIDKSNTNHIGYFHQNIFKYFGNGWNVPAVGFDVVNETQKIFVEMKNKHNTMNSSSSQKTYSRMQNKILNDSSAKCFLVEVIAKNSQNIAWAVFLDGEPISHEQIRRVSIDKFYEIVVGDKEVFKKLCEKLPLVIEDVLESHNEEIMKSSVFEELQNISPNVLKSLYLLSFSRYEGFSGFAI